MIGGKKMDFQALKQTAQYLGENSDLQEIEELENIQKDGKLYLTVWGHYSAGKSKLLNKLLGVDLLPTKTRETTAALTYIEYGQIEGAVVYFEDGRVSRIALSQLSTIFQNTTANFDIDEIRYIDVTLDNPLLKNGIVLVDTPGINTLLERHNLLAASTINQAGKILYVLGGAPSKVDKKFITEISKTGTEIIFVRTKTDNIDPTEEDVNEAIEVEKNLLKDITGKADLQFVALSNEEYSRWFNNLGILREQLQHLQKDTGIELKRIVEQKLKVYAKKYSLELEKRNADVKLAVEGDRAELNRKIVKKEEQIEYLSSRLEDVEESLTSSTKRSKQRTKIELDNVINDYAIAFQSQLKAGVKTENDVGSANELYSQIFEKLTTKTQEVLDVELNKLLANNYPSIESVSPEPPTYKDAVQSVNHYVADYKTELQEIKAQLEENAAELERLAASDATAAEQLREINSQIGQLDEHLKEIPKTPRLYSEDQQKTKPSVIFEKFGKMIDMVTTVIPIFGPTILLSKVDTTIARQLRRADRAARQAKETGIVDAIKGYGKEVRASKRYRERAKQLRNGFMQQAIDQGGSVLDMLDASYWARIIGEQFDLPPRLVVDPEEEKARVSQIDTLNAEKQRHVNDLHAKERNIERLNERKRKVQSETESLLERQKDLEHKQQVAKNEAMQRIAQESINNYINDYVAYFRKNAGELVRRMHEAYFAQALQNIALYVVKTNKELSEQLEEQKQQLSELVETSKNGTNSLEEEITRNSQWIAEFKEFSR